MLDWVMEAVELHSWEKVGEKAGPPSYSTVNCCESTNLTPNCPASARFMQDVEPEMNL